jgi:hypothetical protein
VISAAATDGNKRILHYILDLQGYNFSVQYKRGKQHLDADAVSRLFGFNERPQDIDQLPDPVNTSHEEVAGLDFLNLKRRVKMMEHHRPALEASIRQHLIKYLPPPDPPPISSTPSTTATADSPHVELPTVTPPSTDPLNAPCRMLKAMIQDAEFMEWLDDEYTASAAATAPVLQLNLVFHEEATDEDVDSDYGYYGPPRDVTCIDEQEDNHVQSGVHQPRAYEEYAKTTGPHPANSSVLQPTAPASTDIVLGTVIRRLPRD